MDDKAKLKTYFEKDDHPTQSQFADFIDACLNLFETVSQTVVGAITFQGRISGDADKSAGASDLDYMQKGWISDQDSAIEENLLISLSDNTIIAEGTDSPSFLTVKSNALVQVTSVDNDDGVYLTEYEKKRRYEGLASSGSCFMVWSNLDYPTVKTEIISFRFWINDADVASIYSESDDMSVWWYDGVIISQPTFVIRTIIEAVGNSQSGTFDTSGKASGNWNVECVGKDSGYSCVTISWTDIIYDVAYTSETFLFYQIFTNVVTNFYTNTIDYIGLTWLFGEEANSTWVYPDSDGKDQYPPSLASLQDDTNALESEAQAGKESIVLIDGDSVYVRTSFNSVNDLVQKFDVFSENNFDNNCLNIFNAYLISIDAGNSSDIYEGGTRISASSDDSCPNQYNGTFIGANHGVDDMKTVSSTSHGKTAVDIGSEWTDDAAVKWYILRIVDVDTLWMLSEDASGTDIWSFTGTLTGNLTHSSGATHTGLITVDSYSAGQLYPAVTNQTKQILLDGETELTNNGTYYGYYVDIVNTYDIVNPSSVLDNLIANVGTDYSDNELHVALQNGDKSVFNQILQRIQKTGANETVYGWRNYQEIDINYVGFIQASALNTTGTYPNLKLYSPKALPINDGVTTFDFRDIEDWDTGPIAQLNFTSIYWEEPTSPPERTVMYLSDSGGNRKIGFAQGYDLVKGVGNDRQNLVDNALLLHTSRKNYPKGIDSKLGNIPANTWYSCNAYRIFFDAESSDKDNATNLYYYESGTDVMVTFDYHTTASFDSLKLPAEYVGMNITVIEKSSNVIIHTPQVMQDGITVSVSAGQYAYCVLQLD